MKENLLRSPYSIIISNINNNPDFKKFELQTLINKFEIDSKYTDQLLDSEKDKLVLETLKEKFLEGDLTQMFTYLGKNLSKDKAKKTIEIELIESAAENLAQRKTILMILRKLGNERRGKIIKAIHVIESGQSWSSVAQNCSAFENSLLV